MDKEGKHHNYARVDVAGPQPLFTISGDSGWIVSEERKLRSDERSNPVFKVAAVNESGTWLIDRYGSSLGESTFGQPETKSVLRRLDPFGRLTGEKTLSHHAYRTGAASTRGHIAIMDSDGRLHIYDTQFNVITEVSLKEDPRVVDHFRTTDTNYWGEFKSQVRAVDVADEGDLYLFTLADEAWCCTVSGQTHWGVVMPLNEGWNRIVGRTERFGVAREVEEALELFGLSLPVNPTDIKQRYRALAMTHHPDRNAGNPAAEEMMKALNKAFEILTGVDPNTLSFEESDVTYFARTAPDYVIEGEGFRLEVTTSMGVPQDWIYAASFAAGDGCAYLATYSGKIILLSREGYPLIAYDIGTCPTDIVAVGRYTYFLTYTRLYVVEDRTRLAAYLDVLHGQLIVSQSGFGLLTDRKLQWFTTSGTKVGEVLTRDPIRTVHKNDGGVIVRTRQHQAEIRGPGL